MKLNVIMIGTLVALACSCQKKNGYDQGQYNNQGQYREEYRSQEQQYRKDMPPPADNRPPPGQPGCCEKEKSEQKSQVASPEVKIENKAT